MANFKNSGWRPTRRTPPTAVEVATLPGGETVVDGSTFLNDVVDVGGVQGMRMMFASNETDTGGTKTAVVTFYAIDYFNGRTGREGATAKVIGTMTVQIGTEAGKGGGVPIGYNYADVLTWSANTYGTGLMTFCGGNIADIDDANDIAELLISDVAGIDAITWRCTTYSLTATSTLQSWHKLTRTDTD